MTATPRIARRREYWRSRIDTATTERARMVAAMDYLRATLATAPAGLADRLFSELSDRAIEAAEEAWEAMA